MTHGHSHPPRRTILRSATALGLAGATSATTSAATSAPAARAAAVTLPAISVGTYDVLALLDATGTFFRPREEAFPGATPATWARARRLDPDAFGADGAWVLDFRCFVIRRPGGRLALVDAGVGPANSPAAEWCPVPGRLPQALAEAGLDPADVDTVVLTHLHEDHYGWTRDESGAPVFPNARHLVQQRELDTLPPDSDDRAYIEPLRTAGLLVPVDGDVRLWHWGGNVTLVPTPGHTPGHQSVIVSGRHEEVVLTGDTLVNAVQLADPAIPYMYEADKAAARASRTELLAHARERRAWLATPHLRRPFVRA
ncbi:MBL fold metallo-hydrolase [Streptomyces boninensis]|uniref:MBL fold metallo-hydrolase n=1 Tax=Streptomyces boninensis TaxID=2039455 RepID=UPI003B2229B7